MGIRYEPSEFAADVMEQAEAVASMLIDKNKRYGNSALDPVRIFSKADAVEQIKVRIDDKLSRIARGDADDDEDPIDDLLGYFILLKLALKMERQRAVSMGETTGLTVEKGPHGVGLIGRVETKPIKVEETDE